MTNTIVNWGNKNSNISPANFLGLTENNDQFSCVDASTYDEVVEALQSSQDVEMIIRHMEDYDLETLSNMQKIGDKYPGMPLIAVFTKDQKAASRESMKYLMRNMEKRKTRAEFLDTATDIEAKLESMDPNDEEYQEDALTGYHLTPRQKEVLLLIAKGKSNKQIARMLTMSEGTVKIHCMAIFRELGVNNRTQAAMLAEDLFKTKH